METIIEAIRNPMTYAYIGCAICSYLIAPYIFLSKETRRRMKEYNECKKKEKK